MNSDHDDLEAAGEALADAVIAAIQRGEGQGDNARAVQSKPLELTHDGLLEADRIIANNGREDI